MESWPNPSAPRRAKGLRSKSLTQSNSTTAGAKRAAPGRAGLVVAGGRVGLVPLLQLRNDVLHFVRGQFGEHGQADAAGGVRFGVCRCAENARLLAPRIAGLLVDGDRVMGLRIDPGVIEKIQQQITLLAP